MGFVKWMDSCPLWLKIIFALPGIDLIWAIYRIVKGATSGKLGLVLIGILWIVLGSLALWLVDLICIIIFKHPKLA